MPSGAVQRQRASPGMSLKRRQFWRASQTGPSVNS